MRAWLVNTNTKSGGPDDKKDNPHGFMYMLRHNKAAGFYGRKGQLNPIQVGDLILLYHNQNRIVAVGCAVSAPQEHDYDDIGDVETWVDVNWLWKANFDTLKHWKDEFLNQDPSFPDKHPPSNSINRHDIGLGNFAGIELHVTVLEVTNHLDYKALFAQIADPSRQRLL